jgi:cupin fold WbuC family metalloprotein
MQIIDNTLLDETTSKAKQSERLRMNHNFHETLDNPVNRLINAIEPGSYVRPHRHLTPPKDEMFILLRGKAWIVIFDDEGNITEKKLIDPTNGVYGADIKAGAWHTIISLVSGTVVCEAKAGPFTPLSAEDFATWSPIPEDKEEVKNYINTLLDKVID